MATKEEIRNRGVEVDPSNLPPSLKTNEMTRDQKRNHLRGKGIKGADAEKILDDMYGREAQES